MDIMHLFLFYFRVDVFDKSLGMIPAVSITLDNIY